jgi:threonine aldolase
VKEHDMARINRRDFVSVGAAGAAAWPLAESAAWAQSARESRAAEDTVVRLTGDGVALAPDAYARLLARLLEQRSLVPDSYSLGGIVEELETAFARALGKERAVFMPTGTLANQLAVRALAGGPGRAVLQEDSHLYQDSGDCLQTLSNITVMPLAAGRATFTADDLQRVLDSSKRGRVVSRVAVVSIETPVRRRTGEMFDAAEMDRVIALSRAQGIKLHLDGARIFLQSAYTGTSVADYARPFDTVYVSLYKYFNAPSGAILAGPRDILEDMYHPRRMFGGGLAQAWPFAAIALHYLEGFDDRYRSAVRVAEAWIGGLKRHGAFTVTPVPNGTNLFALRVTGVEPAVFQRRLAERGVQLGNPGSNGSFLVAVNETLNRTTAAGLTEAFAAASG